MSVLHPSSQSESLAQRKAVEADLEVMPSEQAYRPGGPIKEKALAWIIQYVMDNLLRVPGTKVRVGLTPFLEILPIFGDGAAVLASAVTIVEGARHGLPKIVLVRMALNVLLNGAIGLIPGVGEVFSFWFKPSYRNFLLLQKHTAGETLRGKHRTSTGDWIFVVGLLAVLFFVVGGIIFAGAYILWHFIEVLRRSW